MTCGCEAVAKFVQLKQDESSGPFLVVKTKWLRAHPDQPLLRCWQPGTQHSDIHGQAQLLTTLLQTTILT